MQIISGSHCAHGGRGAIGSCIIARGHFCQISDLSQLDCIGNILPKSAINVIARGHFCQISVSLIGDIFFYAKKMGSTLLHIARGHFCQISVGFDWRHFAKKCDKCRCMKFPVYHFCHHSQHDCHLFCQKVLKCLIKLLYGKSV